jgi:2-C-methyl-D-erythritol 4-phosphate cytidylyltransferase
MEPQKTKVTGILLMGGEGSRFGSPTPKQLHRLAGKKVYQHTLEQFLKLPQFDEILLVCAAPWCSEVAEEISIYQDARLRVVKGGATRQESSYLGIKACSSGTQIVVIHDAVRPFVTSEILRANIDGAILHGAVDTCIPSADTIVYAESQDTIGAIPRRSDYWRGQTPQSFYLPLILRAHEKALRNEITNSSDDCSLVLGLGHPVKIIQGSENNLKITTELDLFLAEQILRLQPVAASQGSTASLLGKRYAITGATGGIGQAIVKKLEEAGATVFTISRSSPHYPTDVTSAASTRFIFEEIEKVHGPLDGLINSVGQLTIREVSALFPEEIESLIATNLTGVIYSCKYARVKEGGHIVNIASSSYIRGKKDYAIYSSTKAAVVNFTQGLAEERPHLCINALVPQRTNTPMRRTHFPDEDPETLLDPNEVADATLALLCQSELSGAIAEVRKK